MNLLAAVSPVSFELPSPSRKIWVFAAFIALVLHLGVGLFFLLELDREPEDTELGAPALAIGIELASPRAEPSNLPPGPESEAAAESQAATEQQTSSLQPELPQEKPTEAENADRAVTPNKVTPSDETPDTAERQVSPSEQSIAQEATAPPSVEAPVEATQSVTVDQGTAASRRRARLTWQKELMAHLNRFKRYPTERLQRDAEIIVNLVMDRTGRVVSASVEQSSGHPAFDQAAVAMVEHASPLPAPPPLVADEGLVFQLPVNFRASRRD